MFFINFGFCQCVNFATRGDNILGILLTDDDQLINTVTADSALGPSDHKL